MAFPRSLQLADASVGSCAHGASTGMHVDTVLSPPAKLPRQSLAPEHLCRAAAAAADAASPAPLPFQATRPAHGAIEHFAFAHVAASHQSA